MSDNRHGPMTPIPTKTVLDLTRTVSRLNGKLDEGFDGLKDRISSLESKSDHSCNHPEIIDSFPIVKTLAETTAIEVTGLSKWRWWIMGLVTFIGGAAIAFAINASVSSAVTSTRVDSVVDDIEEHDDQIEDLDDQLHETAKAIIIEVRQQSEVTRTAVKNDHDKRSISVSKSEAKKNLRPYERRQLERLIEKANGKNR